MPRKTDHSLLLKENGTLNRNSFLQIFILLTVGSSFDPEEQVCDLLDQERHSLYRMKDIHSPSLKTTPLVSFYEM